MALRARPIPTVNIPGATPVQSSPPPEFYANEFKHEPPDAEPKVEASGPTMTITADAPPAKEIDETYLTSATKAELAAGRTVAAHQSGRLQAELNAGRAAVEAAAAKLAASEAPAPVSPPTPPAS